MPRSSERQVLNPEFFVLTALAALTRLWKLFIPNAVVFDELHFEHHAGHYLAGTHYFDVHPPLGKLLFAAEARLFGVSAATLLAGQPAPTLRVLPALLGTLIVPLIYILLRQLGTSRKVALLGGAAVLCDNALLADSRFLLLEPLIISFALAAIVVFLASRSRSGPSRMVWLAVAALLAGCALSVKWTGASAFGVILATWAYDAYRTRPAPARFVAEGVLMVAIAGTIYVSAFAVHFALFNHAGADDGMMSFDYRRTLVGDPLYRPGASVSFLTKLADVHDAIARGNRSLEGVTHPAASPWYTWPIMKHPIGLWQDTNPPNRSVILLGNPAVWWGAGIGALLALVLLARRGVPQRWRFGLAFVGGAYLLNYLPFIAITRVMYIYHYLFAELWMTVFACLAVSVVAGWNDGDDRTLWHFASRRSAVLYWSVAAFVLVGFAYFAPLTYGWTLSSRAYDAHFWVLHPHL